MIPSPSHPSRSDAQPGADTSPAGPTLELRVTWGLLGIALLVTFAPAGGWKWSTLVAVPWAAGLLLLSLPGSGPRVDAAAADLLRIRGTRVSLIVLTGLMMTVAWMLNGAAALFLLVWSAVVLISALAAGAAGPVAAGLQGAALSLTLLAAMGGGAEALLRLPFLAEALGTPSAVRAWEHRYDRLWESNLFGFRSPHERIPKGPGTTRVVAIGDSFTWGDKIASSDSVWPARLESRLAAAGRDIEVVNMAQRGYTTANEAEMLSRLGWSFEPDLVLIQFLDNDALPSGPNLRRQGEDLVFPGHLLIPGRFRSDRTRASGLLTLAERYYSVARNRGADPRRLLGLYADSAVGWQQTRAALREVADSARVRGTPVALVIFPRLLPGSWTVESHPMRPAHDKIASAARAEGIRVVDLTAHFAHAGGDWRRWWATSFDAHPGVAAHALAAQAIERELGTLLPQAVSGITSGADRGPQAEDPAVARQ